MKFILKDPPRLFEAGFDVKVRISDCGTLELKPDEQVTFVTELGNEYDVTRKDWGFYATPSLNSRLRQFHLRAVLVKNRIDRYFIVLVEEGKEPLFSNYIEKEKLEIISWLDNLEALQNLEEKMRSLTNES